MQPNIKKVAAIHDICGFGRASLTTIIPTLSAMGIQVCPVPTAVLSTHSGEFTGYTFHDLTQIMPAYTAHWKSIGLTFEGIYSGFLGSPRQVDIVLDIIRDFRTPGTLVVVDPVMGDDGTLYQSVDAGMVQQMRRLIAAADIIVPNYTEAALLLGESQPAALSAAQSKAWLKRLSDFGPGTVMITSLPDASRPDTINVDAYERDGDAFWRVSSRRQPCMYPGTGDLFASVLMGNLLRGESLPVCIDHAVQFVSQCIMASRGYDYPQHYGVLLEKELPLLREANLICGYETL